MQSPAATGRTTKRLKRIAPRTKSQKEAVSFGSCRERTGRTACEIAITKRPSGSWSTRSA